MTPYLLELPFPPSLNDYYENRKAKVKRGPHAGKLYNARMISDEGKTYRQMVWAAARHGHRVPPRLDGRLTVVVVARAPATKKDARTESGEAENNTRWDLDNHWKGLLDALTKAGVVVDDALYDDVRMVRWNRLDGGRIWVVINRFDPDCSQLACLSVGVPHAAFDDILERRLPF